MDQDLVNEEITVERCVDVEYLDRVFADPELREPMMDDSMVDVPPSAADLLARGVVFLKVVRNGHGEGFIMLTRQEPGVFEWHTTFGRECRGRDALTAGRKACQWVWENSNAVLLTSYCPDWLPQSRVYARWLGARLDFYEPNCVRRNGISYGKWHISCARQRDNAEVDRLAKMTDAELGEYFHAQIFALEPDQPHHEEDEDHNVAAGRGMRIGVCECDPARGEREYNALAKRDGHVTVRYLGRRPDGAMIILDELGKAVAISMEGKVSIALPVTEAVGVVGADVGEERDETCPIWQEPPPLSVSAQPLMD